MRRWKKLPPEKKPQLGCLNCGGVEMRRVGDVILCRMHAKVYNGFGGWTITRDGECVYSGCMDLEWENYPTLMTFENRARKDPGHDWRAELRLPLRDATYQRHGKNEWVLVRSGPGFA